MKGAIIGDIVGSIYEWHNIKTKEFPLFNVTCFPTDDSYMTIAVGRALMTCLDAGVVDQERVFDALVYQMRLFGSMYPHGGYGGSFRQWLRSETPEPYHSYGNGAPMRCSSAGWFAHSLREAEELGGLTAMPTHNHREGIKAAETVAGLIYLARTGEDMNTLKEYAAVRYEIPVLDVIRPTYKFDVSSQGTMPVALAAFFESTDFEDAIRNAISVGGDSDTIAAITGSIAEAYYGVPESIWKDAEQYLPVRLCGVVNSFYEALGK